MAKHIIDKNEDHVWFLETKTRRARASNYATIFALIVIGYILVGSFAVLSPIVAMSSVIFIALALINTEIVKTLDSKESHYHSGIYFSGMTPDILRVIKDVKPSLVRKISFLRVKPTRWYRFFSRVKNAKSIYDFGDEDQALILLFNRHYQWSSRLVPHELKIQIMKTI